MKPISNDKRANIIEAKKRNEPVKEIKKWFNVSNSSISRIWKKYLQTGSFNPIPYTGRKSNISVEQEEQIRTKIKENCDITIEKMIEEIGLKITVSGLCRHLNKMGLCLKKKTLHPNNQKRKDVVKKREEWRENQEEISKSNIHFLDESSINLGMTRIYGWGEKSARVNDYVPDVRFERTSIIATLCKDGVNAPLTFKGTLNKDVFKQYIKDVLAPTLELGDIVVMDNCSVHTVKDILNPIYKKGATVLFLPPYSPDLNPIELAWSKMKSVLRMLKARTVDEMFEALNVALDSVTKIDIANWLKHDGYCVNV